MSDLKHYLTQLENDCGSKIKLGLERIKTIAQQLDLLTINAQVITVAGTNGKGSTVAAMESILTEAGYQTAAYTSPHISRFNERIRINQQMVSDDKIIAAFKQLFAIHAESTVSYFEFITLAALIIFKQQPLDVVILEVGLGGRLDAVNSIEPNITVLTSIAIDHQQWLGEDRASIAKEKAGIFRNNIPVILGEPDSPDVIYQMANAYNCPIYTVDEQLSYIDQTIPKLNIAARNAAIALTTLKCLYPSIQINDEHIKKGLKNIKIKGRFEVINHEPIVIIDVAHNPHAAQLLAQNLNKDYKNTTIVAVFGAMHDKDIQGIISPLAKTVKKWYIGAINDKRSASIDTLQQAFTDKAMQNMQAFDSIAQAYQQAYDDINNNQQINNGIIIVFGSFHTVAEVLSFKEDENSL